MRLADRRRHATVVAAVESEIYEIPRHLLRELAAAFPAVGPALESFYRERLLSNLLLTIAFGFSISDVTRRFCDPQSHGWFSQGHALWHWIGALSMVTIFLHYSQPALRERSDPSRSR